MTLAWPSWQRTALLTKPGGEILSAAWLPGSYDVIRRWTGSGWQPILGTHGGSRGPFVEVPNGDIYMATQSVVVHWDGSTWSDLPSFDGVANTIVAMPNGDVMVAGWFSAAGSTATPRVARWDGTAWAPVVADLSGGAYGLQWTREGTLRIVGSFSSINGLSTSGYAELATSCPATASEVGFGCIGSGGLNELAATALPWLGSEYASIATGMPANSLAVHVLGLGTAAVPLSTVLVQGGPGCLLLTTPDALDFGAPVAGEFHLSFNIPISSTLVGATFRQQVVPLELGASGIIAATSTNALELTIGDF